MSPPETSLAAHLRQLVRAGQATRALEVATQHLTRSPQDLGVRLLAIQVLTQRGQVQPALQHALEATQRHPSAPEGPAVLASLLEGAGHVDGALQAWDLAAKRAPPGDAEALRRAGDLCWRSGRLSGALTRLRSAVERDPSAPEAWAVLAAAEASAERLEAAQSATDAALRLAPDNPAVRRLAADVAEKRADVVAARRSYAAMGGDPRAQWAHAVALPPVTDSAAHEDQVRATWRAELSALADSALHAPTARAQDWLEAVRGVFPLHYTGGDLLQEQGMLGSLVHSVVTRALPETAEAPPRPSRDRPRVVFVTSTFRKHTVTKLFGRWMQGLDRRRVSVEALDVGLVHDATSKALRGWCDAVHEAPGSPADALSLLRSRAPDAVVFPEIGMDARILQIAGARSAPLQLVAWGHPVTTGLPTIDGFLSSAAMAVAPDRTWTTEQRVDLPGIGILVDPATRPGKAERSDFGLPASRPLLLCVQSLFKYRPWTDALFTELASRAPNALLVFIEDPRPLVTRAWTQRLQASFQRAGLRFAQHVRLLPRLSEPDWMRLLCVGDLFLDSPGWSGGNTTLEALALGLPTLAFPGDTMRGRHCRGMVLEAGLSHLAPETSTAWLERAVSLAACGSTRADLAEQVALRAPALFRDTRSLRALETLFEDGLPPD